MNKTQGTGRKAQG